MGKEEALDILLDTAENGSVDVEEIKFVFAEMKDEIMLDKIRVEIDQIEINGHIRDVECFRAGIDTALNIINKYKAESENEN